MNVRLVISGRSYDTAQKLPPRLTLDDGCSVDDALAKVAELLGGDSALPKSCLLAVSGTHLGTLANHRDHLLGDGDEIVLIAPVAGG